MNAPQNRALALQRRASTLSNSASQKLADLLDKMLHLDPDRRIGVEDALQHPFIRTHF